MTFSARSFGSARSRAAITSSSAVVRPRAAVPFIGRSVSSSPSRRTKSSGLALTTTKRPRSSSAWCEPRWAWARSA